MTTLLEEQEYEVEQVLDQKQQNRKPVYLIKWKGFKVEEATWEPEENLGNIKKLIAAYEASKQGDKGGKKNAVVDDDDDDVLDGGDEEDEEVAPPKRGRKSAESKLNAASKKIQKQPKAAAPKRGRKPVQVAVVNSPQAAPQSEPESEEEKETKAQTKAVKGKFIKVNKAENDKLGSFDYDRPLKISGHGVLNIENGTLDVSDETVPLEKMYYRVEWEAKGKAKPKDSYYGFDILRQRCPNILLEYVKGMSFSKN